MPTKVSTKGQIVLPADIRKRYGIGEGREIEILDFGKEIVLVPIPEVNAKGFIKFKRSISEIISEIKKEEKEFEEKRRNEICS
jgi:AbrB family looped-hinge helix DNA binding protein